MASSASAVVTVSESHTFPCVPLPGPGDCQGGFTATLTPTCPEGTQVIAGGFRFDALRVAVAVYESRRISNRAWRVSGFEDDTRAVGDFQAFAYCARKPGKIRERAATVDLTGARGTSGTATTHCPRGTQVISGGWSGTPASYIGGSLLRESGRAPKRGWRVGGVKINALGIHPKLTAHAYCAKTKALKGATGAAFVAAPPIGRLRNGGEVESGGCRVRKFAGGGFQLAPYHSILARISELRLIEGGRWRTAAVTYRPPPGNVLFGLPVPDWNVTALAYCG
jgi:hypothetical protein